MRQGNIYMINLPRKLQN